MPNKNNQYKTGLIIGAGPAGLTAAYELLTRTNIKPIVIEKSEYMGGIARTINYKGNRIDIGGHRFFSKSDRVMNWWAKFMPPIETGMEIHYQGKSTKVKPSVDNDGDKKMLIRERKSRIYYMRKLFDYPISLTFDTLSKLGLVKITRIGFTYLAVKILPKRQEKSLEDFFINRFGTELYRTFFKSYTEKVWGVACNLISPEWGAQRIKGLSLSKALLDALTKLLRTKDRGLSQKNTETTLIEKFLYPKHGPGQLWETVATDIISLGGEIYTQNNLVDLYTKDNLITGAKVVDATSGKERVIEADYFFSTMPVKELINKLHAEVPSEIRQIANGLVYRDFITVGLLLNKLTITDSAKSDKLVKDNWIYIHKPGVLVGRVQIFNNWSPYMVADSTKVWIGLEYFCNTTDAIWNMSEAELVELGKKELAKIKFIETEDVIDFTVIKMEKTYPAYFGSYSKFDELIKYTSTFPNLFLIGRNGMHKYNNQDHSMLTAMQSVDNIIAGVTDKQNIWAVNTEEDYHEVKKQ